MGPTCEMDELNMRRVNLSCLRRPNLSKKWILYGCICMIHSLHVRSYNIGYICSKWMLPNYAWEKTIAPRGMFVMYNRNIMGYHENPCKSHICFPWSLLEMWINMKCLCEKTCKVHWLTEGKNEVSYLHEPSREKNESFTWSHEHGISIRFQSGPRHRKSMGSIWAKIVGTVWAGHAAIWSAWGQS